MNEMNEMNNEMQQQVVAPVATQEQQVMVAQQAPGIPEKKGMTTGQKLAGLGLIGFAIAGIVWLITGIVKLVKKVVGLFKKEAPDQQVAAPAPAPAVTQEPVAPAAPQDQQTTVQAATPEQK